MNASHNMRCICGGDQGEGEGEGGAILSHAGCLVTFQLAVLFVRQPHIHKTYIISFLSLIN